MNPRNLGEVGVALDGSLIATGGMDHPADTEGYFPCPEADFVRISRVGGFRIVRCRAHRDRSGFLRAEEFGPELHVPTPLALILERALRSGPDQQLRAKLDHQDGALRSSTLEQPLTDWALCVDEENGAISVDLSARLHGSVIAEWRTSTKNFWRAEDDARITVRFRVDPITRVACYGAYIPSLAGEPGTPAITPTNAGLASLDVVRAPVGTFCQFAVSGGRWYSLYEDAGEQKCLVLTEHGPPSRTSLGLLNDSLLYRWPRIWLYGLDMETIASLLRKSNEIKLRLTGVTVGEAYVSHGSGGHESSTIDELSLDVKLDPTGLHLEIDGNCERGKVSLSLLLLWELLILRFPYFARLISRFESR